MCQYLNNNLMDRHDDCVGWKWYPWNVSECQPWPCKLCWREVQAIKEKGSLQQHLKRHQQIQFCLSVYDRSDRFEKETLLLCGNISSFIAGFSVYCFGVWAWNVRNRAKKSVQACLILRQREKWDAFISKKIHVSNIITWSWIYATKMK